MNFFAALALSFYLAVNSLLGIKSEPTPLVNTVIILTATGEATQFTKNTDKVYFNNAPIEGSDPNTFEVLGWYYSKDKNQVYWVEPTCRCEISIVTEANPSTFVQVSSIHAKDSRSVYIGGRVISDADPYTFVSFPLVGFSKDASHVYFNGESAEERWNIDVATFTSIGNAYYKDKDSVYHFSVDWAGKFLNLDASTFEVLGEDYGRDKGGVYFLDWKYDADQGGHYEMIRMSEADPATFEIVEGQESYDAQDKDHKYLNGKILGYIHYTEPIYINEEYGFQVKMPELWTRYAVRIEKTDEKITVYFGLPLETEAIAQSLSELEKSERVIDLRTIEIMPIAYFETHKDDCSPTEDEMCFYFPEEIIRNEQYVFGWVIPRRQVGWNYCEASLAEAEPYVCSVHTAGKGIRENLTLMP